MTCLLCGVAHEYRACPHHPSTPTPIERRGGVVYRPAAPWSVTVLALLRHLHAEGFTACPVVVGDGFDERGREVVGWIEGEVFAPRPFDDPEPTLFAIGELLRDLHRASASFVPAAGACWRPWTLRDSGVGSVVSHGNVAPWSVVIEAGRPAGFIEWGYSGPVQPLDEVAATGWYTCQLFDDDVAERLGLPDAATRAAWLRAFLDGFRLDRAERVGLVTRMVEFAIRDTAGFARDNGFGPDDGWASVDDQWLMSWQIRAADWLLTHRDLLQRVVEK